MHAEVCPGKALGEVLHRYINKMEPLVSTVKLSPCA
jgi:hypothetical protein